MFTFSIGRRHDASSCQDGCSDDVGLLHGSLESGGGVERVRVGGKVVLLSPKANWEAEEKGKTSKEGHLPHVTKLMAAELKVRGRKVVCCWGFFATETGRQKNC